MPFAIPGPEPETVFPPSPRDGALPSATPRVPFPALPERELEDSRASLSDPARLTADPTVCGAYARSMSLELSECATSCVSQGFREMREC
jgi:hypothetical protein